MPEASRPGLLHRLPSPPRKVALVRPSRLGDFLCAVPAFRALRAALPGAEITMITLPVLEELATRLGYFDRVASFPGFPGLAEQLFDARETTAFLRAMQRERFDLAVQMQGSGVYSNPFTLLLGARRTAGWIRPGDPPGRLDAALAAPERGHEIERVLALATFLGAAPRGTHTEFPLRPDDHERAEALLAGAAPPLIGLHPGARSATRRWAASRFAEVGRLLLERHGGTVVLACDVEERQLAAEVERALGRACRNLTGAAPLPILAALISRLDVLVTNDTGPAHIAYAVGAPVVTVWGGGELSRYGPLQGPAHVVVQPAPCRPCAWEACPHERSCLDAVKVPAVVEAAERLLGGEGRGRSGTQPAETSGGGPSGAGSAC